MSALVPLSLTATNIFLFPFLRIGTELKPVPLFVGQQRVWSGHVGAGETQLSHGLRLARVWWSRGLLCLPSWGKPLSLLAPSASPPSHSNAQRSNAIWIVCDFRLDIATVTTLQLPILSFGELRIRKYVGWVNWVAFEEVALYLLTSCFQDSVREKMPDMHACTSIYIIVLLSSLTLVVAVHSVSTDRHAARDTAAFVTQKSFSRHPSRDCPTASLRAPCIKLTDRHTYR